MSQHSTRRRLARRATLAATGLMLAIGASNAIADGGPLRPEQADVNSTTTQAATTPVFLKLDGIPGESADPSHPGEIDVKSFAFGATNSSVLGGAGKVTFSSISFTKAYDKSSPLLLQHVASGQRIAQATFSFRRPGRTGDGFLVYKFQDLGVSEYQQGGDTGVSPLLEHVVLDFAKVQVSYLPVAGPPLVTAGWDVRLNAPL
jgi:type VI secretion system secreted protein Hcp